MLFIKNNLIYLRNKFDYTLRGLSKEIPMTLSTLQLIECGKTKDENMPIKTLCKLCTFFKVNETNFIHKDLKNEHMAELPYGREMKMIRIKSNLLYLRIKKNLSQNKLSRLSGLTLSSLQYIENGKSKEENITVKTLCKLCEVFNVSESDFIHKDLKNE